MTEYPPSQVTLISDATGSMGEHVLSAIFTQFPVGSLQLKRFNFVSSDASLEKCLAYLKQASGLVVHSTIYESYKSRIEAVCRERGLPVYDLTAPIVDFLSTGSGYKPQFNYRKLHELNTEYFSRIEAIEFAITHDDGRGIKSLDQADVIITGISRTTKTPTCMVLATHGYRAANVPLVAGLDPPRELLSLTPSKVVCLVMQPSSLVAVRLGRIQNKLGFSGEYADMQVVRQELSQARRLSKQHGWRILDVTGRAVEETVARLIDIVSPPLQSCSESDSRDAQGDV